MRLIYLVLFTLAMCCCGVDAPTSSRDLEPTAPYHEACTPQRAIAVDVGEQATPGTIISRYSVVVEPGDGTAYTMIVPGMTDENGREIALTVQLVTE